MWRRVMHRLFRRWRLYIGRPLGLMLLIGQVLIVSAPASAGEELVQELSYTQLVYPQDRGETQLAFALHRDKRDDEATSQLGLGAEYGITDRLQAEVEWTAYATRGGAGMDRVHGIGDTELGVQYSVMNLLGKRTHAAIGASVGLPTGNEDNELGNGETEYESFLALGHEFPSLNNVHVALHGGVSVVANDVESNWSAGLVLPVRALRVAMELSSFEDGRYATPSLFWNVAPAWQMSIGTPIGLASASDDIRLMLLCVGEFQLFGLSDDD